MSDSKKREDAQKGLYAQIMQIVRGQLLDASLSESSKNVSCFIVKFCMEFRFDLYELPF